MSIDLENFAKRACRGGLVLAAALPFAALPTSTAFAVNVNVNAATPGAPFSRGVRGMAVPALNITRPEYTVGIPKILEVSKGSSIRGYAAGLEAEIFDWQTRNNDARASSLQYQRYARDNKSEMIFTANIRGLVGPDTATSDPNDRKYVDTSIATLSTLAGEWVRYTNGITQTYRQGDAVAPSDQAILNKLIWSSAIPGDTWSKLLSPTEGAVPTVKYWEIGNEPTISTGAYGITNTYIFNPNNPAQVTDYRNRYAAIAAAMRAQDSTIQVGPCFLGISDTPLINAILGDPSLPVDFISYHPYYQNLKFQTTGSGMANRLNLLFDHHKSYVDNLRNLMVANGRDPDNIELMASEFNANNWDTNDQVQEARMAHALGTVEEVFSFARLGVRAGHYWVYPAHRYDGTEYPVFRAYEGLRDHMGDTLLSTTSSGLTRVYATRDSEKGEIAVWGLNFSDSASATHNLSITDLPSHGYSAKLMTLKALSGPTSLFSTNLSSDMAGGPTNTIDWQTTLLPGVDLSNYVFTLQAATIAVLVITPHPLPGDFNEDGAVNGADLANWKFNFGRTGLAGHSQGDADGDRDVDGADFLVWQRQVGLDNSFPSTAVSAAVPEPSAYFLAMMTAATLVCSRFRRQRARRFSQINITSI